MTRRRRPGHDRGSATVELAVGLPALIMLLLVGLTAVSAVATKMQALDAAREAALAAARDDTGAAASRMVPPGASVNINKGDGTVSVTVRAPVRVLGGRLSPLTVTGSATAAREPSDIP